jgi:molybdopterin/thiamine biosynthesis adenylyltransferase
MHEQLSHTDRERYRRQLMLRGFTADHQKRLMNSTALIAGVGGLGGTAALYLAAAGIGRMILVHAGNLTLSNMNRQVLMKNNKIGKSRVLQAKKTMIMFSSCSKACRWRCPRARIFRSAASSTRRALNDSSRWWRQP